jgi:hypothetical protein
VCVRARELSAHVLRARDWCGEGGTATQHTQNLQKIGTERVLDEDDSLIDDLHHHLMLLLRICEVDTPLDPITLQVSSHAKQIVHVHVFGCVRVCERRGHS